MYTITRGPSKLVTQRRTGPTQQLDNKVNDLKHKQTSWNGPDGERRAVTCLCFSGSPSTHQPPGTQDSFQPSQWEEVPAPCRGPCHRHPPGGELHPGTRGKCQIRQRGLAGGGAAGPGVQPWFRKRPGSGPL
ncbi:uncharacterized protein [Antennarius striatus]|uniref:uncharacterized protein isoform X2 n=1 Tax=Antennarius striatus TaxID=241820 RepID=UPI0035B19C57